MTTRPSAMTRTALTLLVATSCALAADSEVQAPLIASPVEWVQQLRQISGATIINTEPLYRLNGLAGVHRPARKQHALTDKDAPRDNATGKPARFAADAIDCNTVVDLRFKGVVEALGLRECLACLRKGRGRG